MNRQKVAERLREHLYNSDGIGGVICEILHLDFGYTTDFEIEDILADLIDPTCNDFGGEEGTNGEGYDFACSACGWCCDVCEPNYCPNCGARVVDYVDGGGE